MAGRAELRLGAPGSERGNASQGPAAGEPFLLSRSSTIIGRAEDCDVRLNDPLASRRHAEVRRESWRYLLTDLGSRNGTRVNGEPVEAAHQLQHGDTILIASVPLRFEDPNATVPVARDALRQATYDGRPGHPVLVGAHHWAPLAGATSGDRGARPYLVSHGVTEVECGDLHHGRDEDA